LERRGEGWLTVIQSTPPVLPFPRGGKHFMTTFKLKITPRASKNEIVGELSDGTIKIKLKAPPIDGKANEELIKFLSSEWKIPKTKIKIIRGLTSKNKIIKVE